jgi:hypothetical protein
MRATLILLLMASVAAAAPAPDPGKESRSKLEQLGKKLPDVLQPLWAKHPFRESGRTKLVNRDLRLHRVRLTGPGEAKASFRFLDKEGVFFIPVDVGLRYYDGRWTTVPTPPNPDGDIDYIQRWLGQVVDDAAED